MRWIGYIFWIAGAALFLWALAVAALWALQGNLIFQSVATHKCLGTVAFFPPEFAAFITAEVNIRRRKEISYFMKYSTQKLKGCRIWR